MKSIIIKYKIEVEDEIYEMLKKEENEGSDFFVNKDIEITNREPTYVEDSLTIEDSETEMFYCF